MLRRCFYQACERIQSRGGKFSFFFGQTFLLPATREMGGSKVNLELFNRVEFLLVSIGLFCDCAHDYSLLNFCEGPIYFEYMPGAMK